MLRKASRQRRSAARAGSVARRRSNAFALTKGPTAQPIPIVPIRGRLEPEPWRSQWRRRPARRWELRIRGEPSLAGTWRQPRPSRNKLHIMDPYHRGRQSLRRLAITAPRARIRRCGSLKPSRKWPTGISCIRTMAAPSRATRWRAGCSRTPARRSPRSSSCLRRRRRSCCRHFSRIRSHVTRRVPRRDTSTSRSRSRSTAEAVQSSFSTPRMPTTPRSKT
jgi:hypothetical protein